MNRVLRHTRKGVGIIEMMVLIVVIAFLIALLIPIVQRMRVQEARTRSINNLKNIGLAILDFHDANKRLPFNGVNSFVPGSKTSTAYYCQAVGNTFTSGSWYFQVSPYVDAGPLFNNPGGAVGGGVAMLMCPLRGRPDCGTGNPTWAAIAEVKDPFPTPAVPAMKGGANAQPWTDYGLNPFLNMSGDLKVNGTTYTFANAAIAQGNGLVNCQDARRTLAGITDGASNTVLVGQMSMDPRDYAKSAYVADVAVVDGVARTFTYVGTILHGGTQATSLPNCQGQRAVWAIWVDLRPA